MTTDQKERESLLEDIREILECMLLNGEYGAAVTVETDPDNPEQLQIMMGIPDTLKKIKITAYTAPLGMCSSPERLFSSRGEKLGTAFYMA